MASTTLVGERIDYAAILPGRTKALILAGVLLCLFLSALDQTIVSTALPAIVGDFNGLDLVAWISTGYLLASTAMVPIYGKLSDLYGRRAILVWGIVVFLLGSALCGVAADMVQLVLFRVIQGIGAAALTSTAFAVPADLFAPAERARYMGLFGAVFGLSSVIGPFLGGVLTDQLSWRWVFYVNLPLGLVALAFILRKMPALASGMRAPIDWLGTVFLTLAVVPLLLGLTLDKTIYPWGSPLVLGLLLTAAVATAIFLVVERRAVAPIIAFDLFRNRTFAVSIVVSALVGAAFFGAILFLSLFLVNVVGLSATAAGTAQIPLMLSFVSSSIVASALVQRIGRYKPIIIGGFVVMLAGFFLMTQLSTETQVWDVTWRMVILGLGIGPAMPLLNLAVQNAVPFQQVGSATANRQFFLQLGQAAGAALFGVVLVTTLTAQLATNLGPLTAELPQAVREQLDPAKLRNSGFGSEGAVGDQGDIGAAIVQASEAEGVPAAEAQATATQVTEALRQSFAASIRQIYAYAIWLVAAALILTTLFLPEKPLRKTNQPEEAPSAVPALE
jgi:EmrB/QacA subfamily drug resistance transporter